MELPPQLPPNAKNVFSGILFDVYHWNQRMFDGSSTIFEIISRKSTVDIIATKGSKIMILLQQQPGRPTYPSLPGGRIEEDHSPLETAQRELKEETGHGTKKWNLFMEFTGTSKLYFHEYLFLAKDCEVAGKACPDNGEKMEIEWKRFDEFLQYCREERFAAPYGLKFLMYECLLDSQKKEEFKRKIF